MPLALGVGLLASLPAQADSTVTVWDTSRPLSGTADLGDRSKWKPVATDLLELEADPLKARSDPAYYGRDYTFAGDAVVENQTLTAVFQSAKGRVTVYLKPNAIRSSEASASATRFGDAIVEFVPFQGKPGRIQRIGMLRNAGDEVVLEVSFSSQSSAESSAVFAFDKSEIVEIKPAENMERISLLAPIEYGIVPSFIGDDLVFAAGDYPSADTLFVPAENVFAGLLKGENRMLVLTWPGGDQQLKLRLGGRAEGNRHIEAVDFEDNGQSLYLAALQAPGIWHREELKAAYLEKKVPVNWTRPFPAKWKTQLSEAGVKTTFSFREAPGQIWRGVPGMYGYPVWFEGDRAFYHLSKKVLPKGESIVYFLEGQNTPPAITTPVDIIKATLGRERSATLLDAPGQKLRTHHRRGQEGVRRACTCGGTEAVQAIFEAGNEVEEQAHIGEVMDDTVYFVEVHLERIDEYRRFADSMIEFLRVEGISHPVLKPYLESLAHVAQQIPQEYSVQKDNMKSLDRARDLAGKTVALAAKKDPNNLKAYLALLQAWRAMGGAQDYFLAQCHTITRKLSQEAGYGCVGTPEAVAVAKEVRSRCRQILRNPDGYEIWPNY